MREALKLVESAFEEDRAFLTKMMLGLGYGHVEILFSGAVSGSVRVSIYADSHRPEHSTLEDRGPPGTTFSPLGSLRTP
ncbi:hypothetical protein FACS1894172_19900 [Spirochaetia bacterium]|nr:hypothetical protein FACS1894172_19900 [Spirochaetia bacterium]